MTEGANNVKGKLIAFRDMIVNYKSGWVTIALGTLLFVLVLCIVFIEPCPTRAQYSILRITMAIGISGMSLSFMLFTKNDELGLYKMIWMAFTFTLAYLTNPASMVVLDDCRFGYSYIEGYLVLQGVPVEGAELSLSEYDQKATTNSAGSFFLPYSQEREAKEHRIRIEWGNYDTLVTLSELQMGKDVRIEIPQQVAQPGKERVYKIVNQRMDACLEWIRAQHQGLMDTYPEAEEVTINQLIRSCVPYEKTSDFKRNFYHFSNGVQNLQYKKHLTNAGINPNDYQLESSFKLDFFKAYLFENQSDLDDFHISYSLFNRKRPSFKVLDIRPQENGTCLVEIEYDEAIQYLYVSRNYVQTEAKERKRRMDFYGLKPTENFLLHRKGNMWQLESIQ